ncbi:MAG TPA: histidine kinase dimerization/phosphoacceptor domain-containing protein, partial [Pyrinomonadaceae bacterium]|nr:histidine kinase dimerization/phosphoacceptor domain-containing protein [Pyrinomonadaceae bacterium]
LAERTRIAQDLHDTLLQGLVSASMQLHVANDHLADDSRAKPLVGRVMELMGQVIEEGRDAVRGALHEKSLFGFFSVQPLCALCLRGCFF